MAALHVRNPKLITCKLLLGRLPFETEMLGVTVSVESIDITEDDQLVAVCRKGEDRQRISLTELPLPKTLSEGGESDRCVSVLANRNRVNARA